MAVGHTIMAVGCTMYGLHHDDQTTTYSLSGQAAGPQSLRQVRQSTAHLFSSGRRAALFA
eukprot:1151640-Pelagomonas_calceolata.AAC.2